MREIFLWFRCHLAGKCKLFQILVFSGLWCFPSQGLLHAQFVTKGTPVEGSSIHPQIHHPEDKKLIQVSSGLEWTYVRDNIRQIEADFPDLDGVAAGMVRDFAEYYRILTGKRKWNNEDIQLDVVSAIEWGRYTENFIILSLCDTVDYDFFNEEKWEVIMHNARMVSRMVQAGGFKGVILDNENYFPQVSAGWAYRSELYPDRSPAEVRKRCRELGRAFMKALQSEADFPISVINMFWFGDYWANYGKEGGRQELYLPFMDGMLDVSAPENEFVDANECAYYYQETKMFTDIYQEFRTNRFKEFGALDLQDRFQSQVQIGHGLNPKVNYGIYKYPYTCTPEEQVLWAKNQLYHALLTSDKYVWIWKWWGFWDEEKEPFPPSFQSMLGEVRCLLRNGHALGYDVVKYGSNWEENLVTPSEKWHISRTPEVTITQPAAGLLAGSELEIAAETSSDALKVEFFVNSMLVGADEEAPFSCMVSGLEKGAYTIFARAYSKDKEHNTSAPIIIDLHPNK